MSNISVMNFPQSFCLIKVAGMRSEFETVSTLGITFIAPTNEAFKTLDGNATKFLRSSKVMLEKYGNK